MHIVDAARANADLSATFPRAKLQGWRTRAGLVADGQFRIRLLFVRPVAGLSIAEIAGGIARALRSRGQVRRGFVAPLRGPLLFIDLVSFWADSWEMRAAR